MYPLKLCFVFGLICSCVNCVKILCIFHFPSVSHQMFFQPIWRELSLKGHQVTVITPNPIKDPNLTNLTEIDVSFVYDILYKSNVQITLSKNTSIFRTIPFLFDLGTNIMESQIKHKDVQNLIHGNKSMFDLIIFQNSHIFNLVLGYVGTFKCPAIGISSMGAFLHSHDALGNPTHPSISPDIMLNVSGKVSFFDRVKSFLFNFWYRAFYYWYALSKADKIARRYFGDNMPYLGDIEKNLSLMMINNNPLIHTARANVPNLVEINLMHIREQRPLPQELQEFLDKSLQGAIYISFGSNVRSANLPTTTRKEIIACLEELPYNVIWKWEADYLPGQPKNVLIRKWLPQQDILGHPNLKAFVTQGGLQSIEEAIYNEVPMVGMPFITDQPSNIHKIVEMGMGLDVDYISLTKHALKKAIIEVIENKKYKEEVRKGRAFLIDQPMKGVEKAIWWIEYVIRHKGAKILRSPAADMTFFEYFMIDVVIFLLLCIFVFLYCIIQLISLIQRSRRYKQKLKRS